MGQFAEKGYIERINMTDNEIIHTALVEYEENYWQVKGQKWQKQVNRLIEKYRKKVENES